jgi:hypothetical protein
LIEYPLQQLDHYGLYREPAKLNNRDAYIFASFVSDQIDHLKEIARELDEEYGNPPERP